MDITIIFENGAAFDWKRVRASELNSVFADITDLAEKAEAARKAFKKQGRINGTKKAVRKVNKETKKCQTKAPRP
jgi:hypothetical protein